MDGSTCLFVWQLIQFGYEVVTSMSDDGTIVTWGTDSDGDGVPDVDVTEWLVSSDGAVEKSFIIMSADGTMTVYDEGGNITAEDCDTAYSLWVSENGIMNKPLDNYTVTEGLLLIAGIVACFGFVAKLFRRRKVM